MDFSVQYLSFFVIQTEGEGEDGPKRYKHYKTLDREEYEDSEIKSFLDGEFARIGKRKAELNPKSDNAPTKIGRFLVEPGHELTSNPNYNLFQRLRNAAGRNDFQTVSDELVRMYMDTSAVRGGALIVASAKLNKYFDEPFLFVLKCDFEAKIARISDEKSLISRVEMAISARSIKSIQYPHMPEEGMREEWELKIHQASHARYFEDFLKFVSYEKSMPEILNEQVMTMVQQYMETKWQDAGEAGAQAIGGDAERQAKSPEEAGMLTSGEQRESDREQQGNDREQQGNDREQQENEQDRVLRAHQESPRDAALVQADDRVLQEEDDRADAGDAEHSDRLQKVKQPKTDRQREEERFEMWAAGEKRVLQEKWTHDHVLEATSQLVELKPDLEMKFKLNGVSVRGKLTDYGKHVHFAEMNGRYVVLIEGDAFQFDKGVSPVELLQPDDIAHVLKRMAANAAKTEAERADAAKAEAERAEAASPNAATTAIKADADRMDADRAHVDTTDVDRANAGAAAVGDDEVPWE